MEEAEWYSECCSAPPLYEVHEVPIDEHMGICMKCREHAMFEVWGDEDPYENN